VVNFWIARKTDTDWSEPHQGWFVSVRSSAAVGSRDGAEVEIYGDAPLFKQPFWDIAPIPVLLAPGAERTRRGIRPCRKLQLPDPQFEFSRESGSERNGMPPIGVSAFAPRRGESN
jgi:hypothetical protein